MTCKDDLTWLGTLIHQTSFLCLLSTAASVVAKYAHVKEIENRDWKRQRDIDQ